MVGIVNRVYCVFLRVSYRGCDKVDKMVYESQREHQKYSRADRTVLKKYACLNFFLLKKMICGKKM